MNLKKLLMKDKYKGKIFTRPTTFKTHRKILHLNSINGPTTESLEYIAHERGYTLEVEEISHLVSLTEELVDRYDVILLTEYDAKD